MVRTVSARLLCSFEKTIERTHSVASGKGSRGPGTPPTGSVLGDPIHQGRIKSDVVPGFLRFNPLVLQDLFLLGEKLPIQRGTLEDACFQTRRW